MTDEGLPVWDLSRLYAGADDPAIEADLAEAERLASELSAHADPLAAYERANALLARIAAFAALYDDGRLAPMLQPRIDAVVAAAPALADIAPDLETPPEVESRVIATLLSAIAEAGPRLWHRTNLQTDAELLPWTWAEAVEIAAEAADGLSPAARRCCGRWIRSAARHRTS